MISSIKDFKAVHDQKRLARRQIAKDKIESIHRHAKAIILFTPPSHYREKINIIKDLTEAVRHLARTVESLRDQDNGRMT